MSKSSSLPANRRPEPRQQLACWIPASLKARLSAAADKRGCFDRHLVVLALEAYLSQVEKVWEVQP
jgi:hypothetical protein